MQPQVPNRPREDGRIPTPEDLRLWHLTTFAGGATGLLYPRWRPLLDGPLFGAFGPYGMDGLRTSRSEMTSTICKWATDPAQAKLWASQPVRGEVGILLAPETELYTYAQQGSTDYYARSMHGAYQGFFDLNVQADFCRLEQIDEYKLLYLPFPVMLKQATADALIAWVEAGGVLVAEGCPGYHGDLGHVGATQPNLGLDALFGARESYVEFTPDLLGDLQFNVRGARVRGGLYMQTYEPTSGTPVGWYDDGRVAAVDHVYGQGKTRLLGTMCGAGYDARPARRSPELFAGVLAYGGIDQHIVSSDPRVKARLHDGPGGTYLWVANPSRQPVPVRLTFGQRWGPYSSARTLWGAQAEVAGRIVTLTAGARDLSVLVLQ
jgi:beta-galactosidase